MEDFDRRLGMGGGGAAAKKKKRAEKRFRGDWGGSGTEEMSKRRKRGREG